MFSSVKQVEALSSCTGVLSGVGVMLPSYEDGNTHTIKIDMSKNYNPDHEYYIKIKNGENVDDEAQTGVFRIDVNKSYDWGTKSGGSQKNGKLTVKNGIVTWTTYREEALKSAFFSGENDKHIVRLYDNDNSGTNRECNIGTYQTTKNETGGECALYISQTRNGKTCYSSGCLDSATSTTKIEVEGLEDTEGNPFNDEIKFVIKGGGTTDKKANASNGKASTTFEAKKETTYEISIVETANKNYQFPGCSASFIAQAFCEDETCDEVKTDASGNALVRDFELCEQILDPGERNLCKACFGGDDNDGNAGVWTAIGCIPAKPESIIKTFITIAISAAGGATFLLILAGAFRLSVSQGDPQATKEAKEQITAALTGLVFILLSITMLRFIGVTLFEIPGFGG